MRAQVAQAAPSGSASRTSSAVAPESTTCPPWAVAVSRAQRYSGRPEVVGPLHLHLPRVQPHPRPDGARAQLAPVLRLQGQLPGQGGGDRVGGRAKAA